MPRVDDIVDDENAPTGDCFVVSPLQMELLTFGSSHPFCEDTLDSKSQRRVLGADDASNGRPAHQIRGASGLEDGLGEHAAQITRTIRIHVDDILGDPSWAVVTRCVDEVIILDQRTAVLEHATRSLLPFRRRC